MQKIIALVKELKFKNEKSIFHFFLGARITNLFTLACLCPMKFGPKNLWIQNSNTWSDFGGILSVEVRKIIKTVKFL